MPGQFGNKGGGRKGFGIENAKKHYLEKSFYIANKSLDKDCNELKEKEKINEAHRVAQKEIGKNIDITTKGESINQILVKFKDGTSNDRDSK